MIKDWVDAAAVAIYNGEDSSPGTIAEAIREHCPFKPNVAYMPVIRTEPGHVYDWAAQAAEYLSGDNDKSVEHVAAVITTFADLLP